MFEMLNLIKQVRSNMSEKLFEFYQSYSRGSYIATIGIDQKTIDKCQQKIGLDINKSYTNVILNSGYDQNLQNLFDEIVKYDGREIIQGSHFLSKGIVIEKINVIVPPGLFEYPIVQWTLKNKFVKKEDITHMIIQQKMVECKTFERMVLTTIAAQESDDIDYATTQFFKILNPEYPEIIMKKKYGFAKHVINNFIGCMAKGYNKKMQGTVINNYLEACVLFNQVMSEGNKSSIYQHQNMFFVTSTSKTAQFKIFYLFIDRLLSQEWFSYSNQQIAVRKIQEQYLTIQTMLLSLILKKLIFRSILQIRICMRKNLMQKYGRIDLNQIRRIKKEEFKIRGQVKEKCDEIIPEIIVKEFKQVEEKKEINETIQMLSKISCLINAGSGVGKTYLCARLIEYLGDEKYLVLCFTNVAVDNLRKQGVKNVQTLIFQEVQKIVFETNNQQKDE